MLRVFHSFVRDIGTRLQPVTNSRTLITRPGFLNCSSYQIFERTFSTGRPLHSSEIPDSSEKGTRMSRSDQNSTAPKSVFLKQETIHKEKWLSLERVTYRDPKGKERTWEVAERTTKSKTEGIGDCVAMIAILNRLLHYDCIVLVKQFRPPLKGYTIEFPAGLVDPNETLEEAALRELKEETGYTGTVLAVSPCTALDPGMSSSSCSFIHVQIDGNDNANDSAVAHPEEGEFTEVLLIPVNELLHRLQEMAKQKDVVIDAQVYMYAVTLSHPHLGMVPSTIINSD